jgi:hypothetical protein
MDAAVGFVQLTEDRTVDDLRVPPEAAPPGPGATPGAGMVEGSPSTGGPPEDAFAWLYETYIAGGAGARPGQTVQAFPRLPPAR